MRSTARACTLLLLSFGFGLANACGDDSSGSGTQADRIGVGAQCTKNSDCLQTGGDGGIVQTCLTEFKGGYCGLKGCTGDTSCPDGSACVTHDNGQNYCFRICRDKSECNLNRTPAVESNCSSNVDFVAGKSALKACVPPSSG
jgi:hypothetical protein